MVKPFLFIIATYFVCLHLNQRYIFLNQEIMRFVIYNHALLHKNPFPRVMKFTISVEHSLRTVNILSLSAREEKHQFYS